MLRKLTSLVLPLALAATLATQAAAGPWQGAGGQGMIVAAGGCGRAAAQAAASTGGQVIGVRQAGQSCIVTVLVTGRGGNPPRRVVMTLPAG